MFSIRLGVVWEREKNSIGMAWDKDFFVWELSGSNSTKRLGLGQGFVVWGNSTLLGKHSPLHSEECSSKQLDYEHCPISTESDTNHMHISVVS